jgi:putative polyhydroxyalkanoate system protein
MSDIHFKRSHQLSLKDAKKVAQKAADDLAAEYDLESEWDGDTLHFHRSGVEGHIHVTDSQIDLNVKLGFLLRPFKATFEKHIEGNIEKMLAKPAAKKTTRKA